VAFDELINLGERLKPAIELADGIWQSVLDSSLTSGALVGGLLGGAAVLSAFLLLRRFKRGTRRTTRVQKTLDALPDAVALFNPKGQLTALNRKLQKLMPLEIDSSAFPETTTSDLYAQISPEVKERMTEAGGVAISIHGGPSYNGPAMNDPLTALPNRTSLVNALAQRCSRTRNELALMIVDLRSFRQINDSYGRAAGDELLKQTAICLQHCMPHDALIARTAGDEFAVLLEADVDRRNIEKRVTLLLTTLRAGLNVRNMNVPARASVGIAYAPEHGNTVSSLLKAADSACAHAKRLGNNTLVVFNSSQQQQAKRRHQLEIGLQRAVEKNELSLQYQPQIDIRSMMTCGMEALLRWKSAEYGRVSPADFIPIAEQTGIINHLGSWVLRQAVQDYQRLARYGMSPAMMSVNLSRKQFDNGRIVHEIEDLLKETNFNPEKLCLEITETALFSDSSKLRAILHDLTSLGTRIAIDDFGVGYSVSKIRSSSTW